MRRSIVIDFRDKRFPLCGPADLPSGAARDVRRAVARASRHQFKWVLGSGLAVGTVFWIAALLLGQPPGGMSLSDAAVWVIVSLLLFVVVMAIGMHGYADMWGVDAVRACLAAGLCASCGYALGGSSPDLNGCTVCPECGAAWRLGPSAPTKPAPSPETHTTGTPP